MYRRKRIIVEKCMKRKDETKGRGKWKVNALRKKYYRSNFDYNLNGLGDTKENVLPSTGEILFPVF